jgi:hypothetical protein
MDGAIFLAVVTAYAGLLIWLPIRVFSRLESWEAALAVLVIAGGIGGAIVVHLSQILALPR